ncbi:MAG: hypothetical protein V1755_06580 [Chloroflexota bacterium]
MLGDWRGELKQNWANVRLAHEAMMLDKLQHDGRLIRRLARKTQDGTLGQATAEPEDAEGDEMGVSIGNTIYYGQPNPVPTTSPPPPVTPAPAPVTEPAGPSAATPLWKKALATAALVGAGATGGVGIPAAYQALWPAEQQVQPAGYGLDVEKFLPSQPK